MNMTDKEKLKIAETSIKNLETRVVTLEEQVALCLRALRKLAETEAKKKDPKFTVRENVEN
jgi:hypothetical protein